MSGRWGPYRKRPPAGRHLYRDLFTAPACGPCYGPVTSRYRARKRGRELCAGRSTPVYPINEPMSINCSVCLIGLRPLSNAAGACPQHRRRAFWRAFLRKMRKMTAIPRAEMMMTLWIRPRRGQMSKVKLTWLAGVADAVTRYRLYSCGDSLMELRGQLFFADI